MTDYNFSFNWEKGGAPTIPLGMQVGKIVRIGKQPMACRSKLEAQQPGPEEHPTPG